MLVRTMALGLLMGALAVVGPAPATADGVYPLPQFEFGQIVVDESSGHLFLAPARALPGPSQPLLVRDLEGAPVAEIPLSSGNPAMLLDHSRNALWVTDDTAVKRVDLTTLETTSVSVGETVCAQGITMHLGLLWVGVCVLDPEAPFGYWNAVVAVDPETGERTAIPSTFGAPTLLASDDNPGTILASSTSGLTSFAVTGGSDPTITWRAHRPLAAQVGAALLPGGDAVVIGSGEVLRSSDLSPIGRFGADHRSGAGVAVRQDGLVAIEADGIEFFERSQTVTRSYPNFPVVPNGLAFGADQLYLVTRAGLNKIALRVLTFRRLPKLTVAADRRTRPIGTTATVTATLSGGSTNRSVSIYATPEGGVRRLVGSGRVDSAGHLTVRQRVRQHTTYSAVYTGDADYDPVSASTRVKVGDTIDLAILRSRRVVAGIHQFRVGDRAVFRARVQTVRLPACVEFTLSYRVRGESVAGGYTRCIPVSERGVVKAVLVGSPAVAGYVGTVRASLRADGGRGHTTESKRLRYHFTR